MPDPLMPKSDKPPKAEPVRSLDEPKPKPSPRPEAPPAKGRSHMETLEEACDELLISHMTPGAKWAVRSMRSKGMELEKIRQVLRLKGALPHLMPSIEAYWAQLDQLPHDDPRLEPGDEPA